MNVERDRGHLEGGVLGLPSPVELRVKVRIVCINSLAPIPVCVGGDETYGRIIHTLLVGMNVVMDLPFLLFLGILFLRRHSTAFTRETLLTQPKCAVSSQGAADLFQIAWRKSSS